MTPEAEAMPQTAAPLNPDALLRDTEAAEWLGCSVQTLRNFRWKGEPPKYHRIGKRMVRYRVSDLEAFINGEKAA